MTPTNEPSTERRLDVMTRTRRRIMGTAREYRPDLPYPEYNEWCERLNHATDEIDAEITTLTNALTEARAENKRLREALMDYAEHGLRADLNPTIAGARWERVPVGYLDRIDASIRQRAQSILKDAPKAP